MPDREISTADIAVTERYVLCRKSSSKSRKEDFTVYTGSSVSFVRDIQPPVESGSTRCGRTREQVQDSASRAKDTAIFSDEALALAKDMWINAKLKHMVGLDEDDDSNSASAQSGSSTVGATELKAEFRKKLDVTSVSGAKSPDEQLSKLEKQIKDLQKKIEQAYASDLPDNAKETMVKQLREQLDQLMKQKNALKAISTYARNT